MRSFFLNSMGACGLVVVTLLFSSCVAKKQPTPPAAPPSATSTASSDKEASQDAQLAKLSGDVQSASEKVNAAMQSVNTVTNTIAPELSRLNRDADALPALQSQLNQALADLKRLERVLVQRAMARRASSVVPIDDYVPCELNPDQTKELKFLEPDSHPPDLSSALEDLRARGIDIQTSDFDAALSHFIGSASPIRETIDALAESGKLKPKPGQKLADAKAEVTTALSSVVAGYTAPTDVSCSMILMPWQVTADSFGRHVADQYIAFQVVVRNLNGTQEFLMHSVNIAVDHQRFYSGIDKMLVRNSQAHGQYYDRRNFAMRALEVAGDIAAGAAPFGSADTRAGIGVFRAAFIPGMEKIFPDRYLQQVNALNDMGFSSSTAYKIVVPVKGSAPFVTFLPADIFSRRIPGAKKGDSSSTNKKDWLYKYWSPDDLHAFTEATFVIAAGIHVQEVQSAQPSITSIDCKGANGSIDLSKADSGGTTLTCLVTGQNLDQVSKIRLRNATETTDTVTADGILTLSGGQKTSGSAVFQVADLSALKGTSYAVYIISGPNKTELPTTTTVELTAAPSSTPISISVGSSSCSTSNCSVTITGQNLGQAQLFLFEDTAGSKVIDSGAVAAASDNSGVTVVLTHLSGVAAGSYQIVLQSAGTNIAKIPVTLTVTTP